MEIDPDKLAKLRELRNELFERLRKECNPSEAGFVIAQLIVCVLYGSGQNEEKAKIALDAMFAVAWHDYKTICSLWPAKEEEKKH